MDFDRVTEGGSSAMGFDVLQRLGIDPGGVEGLANQGNLGRSIRCGQSGAGAVMIDCRAANERLDPVAIRHGVRKSLQNNDTASFASTVAVGRRIEGLATSAWRQGIHLREDDAGKWGGDHVRSTGQRQVALSVAQGLSGEVHGDERG